MVWHSRVIPPHVEWPHSSQAMWGLVSELPHPQSARNSCKGQTLSVLRPQPQAQTCHGFLPSLNWAVTNCSCCWCGCQKFCTILHNQATPPSTVTATALAQERLPQNQHTERLGDSLPRQSKTSFFLIVCKTASETST